MPDAIDTAVAWSTLWQETVLNRALQTARGRTQRESLLECEDCGVPIPDARRQAVPGVRRCRDCQEELENAFEP